MNQAPPLYPAPLRKHSVLQIALFTLPLTAKVHQHKVEKALSDDDF